jgi:hypothetical protein
MIYGNNVDANFEYLQRRRVEKALDALQAKHDELAELVQDFIDVIELRGLSLPFCLYEHIAALRKAVEEK